MQFHSNPRLVNRSASIGIAVLLLATVTVHAAEPNPLLAPWLGQELKITTSSVADHIPVNGRLTLVYDADDDVVRVCTRSVTAQRATWRMDFAIPCNVALVFTPGTRYCSRNEVKTGDAELLSQCHRLRSHDVAMHPAAAKGAVELHDMIVFLLSGVTPTSHPVYMLVDSPAHLTHAGGGDAE